MRAVHPASLRRGVVLHRGHSAFTLVELLVVVALLLILFSLLFPSLDRAHGTAKQVQCMGKLRAIGTGVLMYLSDNHVYPVAFVRLSNNNQVADFTWGEAIYPYISNGKPPPSRAIGGPEFSCPGTIVYAKVNGQYRYLNSYMISSEKGTAGMDTLKMPKERGIDPYPGESFESRLPLGAVPAPAGTFISVDGVLSTKYTFLESNMLRISTPKAILDNVLTDPTDGSLGIAPHGGQNNWLFCDGHVKRMQLMDTIGSGVLGRPYGMWTRDADD